MWTQFRSHSIISSSTSMSLSTTAGIAILTAARHSARSKNCDDRRVADKFDDIEEEDEALLMSSEDDRFRGDVFFLGGFSVEEPRLVFLLRRQKEQDLKVPKRNSAYSRERKKRKRGRRLKRASPSNLNILTVNPVSNRL